MNKQKKMIAIVSQKYVRRDSVASCNVGKLRYFNVVVLRVYSFSQQFSRFSVLENAT